MRKRGASPAMAALQAAVAARGRDVSVTRLEGWCYWRTGGLIDRPIRRGAGRGTRSEFPDLERASRQAATVAESLRPRESLDALALRLYGTGFKLRDEDVKAAALAELASARRRFERNTGGQSADRLEHASRAGWAAYRFFTQGSPARTRRETLGRAPSHRAWTAAGLVLLGEPLSPDQLTPLIAETPIAGITRLVLKMSPDEVAIQIAALAPTASFESLTNVLRDESAADVASAIKTATKTAAFLARLAPGLAPHANKGLTLGITLGFLLNPAFDVEAATSALELLSSMPKPALT